MKLKITFFLTALFLLSACSYSTELRDPLPVPPDYTPPTTPPTPRMPSSGESTACIEIYQPVCGKIQVQCITTPCDPVKETFSNRCYAEKAGAFDISEGACF